MAKEEKVSATNVKHDKEMIISFAKTKRATEWKNKTVAWSHFIEWLSRPRQVEANFEDYAGLTKEEQSELKDGPAFVGGPLKNNRRSSQSIQQRFIIALDVDDARHDLLERVKNDLGFEAAYYSTLSHQTADADKYRIIFPLSRSVQPAEYEAITRKVAELLGAEQFDPTTVQPERLMFGPAQLQDGPFEFGVVDTGKFMDPDAILDYYEDWTDRSEWAMLGNERKQITDRYKKLGDPREKQNLIGAFCQAYSISEAMEEFIPGVYIHSRTDSDGTERYSYKEGKGADGVLVYDDTFLHSFHGTDPVSGMSVNAFDLVRIHLFGELDSDYPPETPSKDLPSFKETMELAAQDPNVQEIRHAQSTGLAQQEFSDVDADILDETDEQGDTDAVTAPKKVKKAKTEKKPVKKSEGPASWLKFNKNGDVSGVVYPELAREVIQEVPVFYTGRDLYMYEDDKGIWTTESAKAYLKSYLMKQKLGNLSTKARIDETIAMIENETLDRDKEIGNHDLNKVVVTNGVYDLIDGTFTEEFDRELFATVRHPIEYDPNAKCDRFIEYLKFAVGEENIDFIFEWFGYTLWRDYQALNNILFIHGKGGTGKSTLVQVMTAMLGVENTSSVPIRTLMTERFAKASLFNKNANVDTDAEPHYLADGSVIKQLTGQDQIFADRKNQKPLEFTSHAKLTFATNELPPMRDFSGGLERRMLILPMNHKITQAIQEAAPIDAILEEELPGIFNEAVKRLPALLERRSFTVSDTMKKEVHKWVSGNDVTSLFIEDECEISVGGYTKVKEMYSDYKNYCRESGYHALSKNKFNQRLEELGHERKPKRIEGKVQKVWTGVLGPSNAGLDF